MYNTLKFAHELKGGNWSTRNNNYKFIGNDTNVVNSNLASFNPTDHVELDEESENILYPKWNYAEVNEERTFGRLFSEERKEVTEWLPVKINSFNEAYISDGEEPYLLMWFTNLNYPPKFDVKSYPKYRNK